MKKLLLYWGIFLLTFFLFFLGQWLYFYPEKYQPPSSKRPNLEEISLPKTEVKTFSDAYKLRKGTVLLDLAHDNNFALEEFDLAILRITSRGYLAEYLKESGDLKEKLRFVDTFITILPQKEFSREEAKLIKEFRDKGGRVLLIGDPTRPSKINSLAAEFGLIFESDYLYNLKENDGNFRHIFITNFKSGYKLTKNLEKIALYDASSINPATWGIAFGDENTFSSTEKTRDTLSPILLSEDLRVLAISDFTFLIEPLNSIADNNQFIANLADWLTKSERALYLSNFPYFFEEGVQVTYTDAAYLDLGLKLKNLLANLGKNPKLTPYTTTSKNFIFIGLFTDASKMESFLKEGGILIDGAKIKIEGIGEIDKKEASIIYLTKTGDALIVLSDSKERLKDSVNRLVSGEFRDLLVTDLLSVHRFEQKETEKPIN